MSQRYLVVLLLLVLAMAISPSSRLRGQMTGHAQSSADLVPVTDAMLRRAVPQR